MICLLSSVLAVAACFVLPPESLSVYDLYRLTTASTTSATSTPFTHTYTYTPIGNIASSTTLGAYTYAETNYANPHAPTSIAGNTLIYDSNGNLSSYLGTSYTFDHKNRLTQTAATTTTTYGYDHTIARIFKYDGTATTTYPNKYFSTIAATTTKYVFLPDGDLIATIEGNGTATTTSYIHPDYLGSTNAVTNTSGTLAQLLDYYPYGSKRIERGSDVSNREYIGQHFDEETDLSYLNARYYEPARGQFTSQDPSFLDIGGPGFGQKYGRTLQQHLMNPQALNSYSYALNNPVTLSDPEGEIVPILIAAYAAFEIGLSAYDAYTTAQTIADPNASFGEKAVTGTLFLGGLVAPGGGYAQVPKVVDKATDATKVLNKASDTIDDVNAGIIYLRKDRAGVIEKPYIGQTKSESRFLERQKEHQRANPNSRFNFNVLDRGKPGNDLNLKEQNLIDRFGGPTNKSNPSGGTSNKKNVIRK